MERSESHILYSVHIIEMSTIYDLHSTPSVNIHCNFNFRRFFLTVFALGYFKFYVRRQFPFFGCKVCPSSREGGGEAKTLKNQYVVVVVCGSYFTLVVVRQLSHHIQPRTQDTFRHNKHLTLRH